MTCSPSPFPSPSCGKRSWDRGKQHGAEGREGEKANSLSLYIYTDLCGRYKDLYLCYSSRCLWALPAHAWSLLLPLNSCVSIPCPSCCLSCSPIVDYFLFGAVDMYGEGRVFFPTSGPNCLHIVNSTSLSPIKQANRAWLYIATFLSNFFAKKTKAAVL